MGKSRVIESQFAQVAPGHDSLAKPHALPEQRYTCYLLGLGLGFWRPRPLLLKRGRVGPPFFHSCHVHLDTAIRLSPMLHNSKGIFLTCYCTATEDRLAEFHVEQR